MSHFLVKLRRATARHPKGKEIRVSPYDGEHVRAESGELILLEACQPKLTPADERKLLQEISG